MPVTLPFSLLRYFLLAGGIVLFVYACDTKSKRVEQEYTKDDTQV